MAVTSSFTGCPCTNKTSAGGAWSTGAARGQTRDRKFQARAGRRAVSHGHFGAVAWRYIAMAAYFVSRYS